MITWADAHRLGMLEVGRLLRELDVDPSDRIPVESIADHLDLVVHYKPLPRLAGAYVAAPDSPPGVLVNSKLAWSKQRFTLAHEIGHHRFSHESTLDLEVGSFARGLGHQERVAEAFAAWLLMPRQAVQTAVDRRALKSPADLYQVSLRLGVSYQAACVHMTNLRVLDYSTAESWARIPPKTFKQGLLGTKALLGSVDVHLVDEADDGGTLYVRPGDIVVPAGSGQIAVGGAHTPLRIVDDGADVRIYVEAQLPANPGDPMDRFDLRVGSVGDTYSFALVVERKRLGVHYRWFER